MKLINKTSITAALILISGCLFSQETSKKLIKASSPKADIRVDSILSKQSWSIDPNYKLDIFEVREDAKRVTFYTDIDSISYDIVPRGIYDFGVLVNEKDTAWTQIKATAPNYLLRLKKGEKYNFEDNREIVKWEYMDQNDANLQALRAEFNLDSISGNGDEMSKIVNLMYWIHNTIRHDGNSNNPEKQNAHDIIKICKAENRGVNCRMLSIALNECYLAMGFKSRYVTCMPKGKTFDDCHVINAVYSQDLNKWVWMDPTNAGFVKDENGVFLSIQEVRDRLVNGLPVFANENLNWNGEAVDKLNYLKTYMAKNLYRIQSPAFSGYDIETHKEGNKIAYNELFPVDGSEESSMEIGELYRKTNNPELFWQKP